MTRESGSGLPIGPGRAPDAFAGWDPTRGPAGPGGFPCTRDIHASMGTGQPRTVRPYAGLGSAVESNARFRQLVADGATGLSVAFDLPSRMGHDSDAPIAAGGVGQTGVAVDSIDDMRVLFGGIPLAEVSTSLQLGAPGGAPFLLLCQLVGEEQGVAADRLTGTIQSDVLEEYVTRGTYLFPPGPSLRLVADIFRYCEAEVPEWVAVSVSGRNLADAGASPEQEIAFTLADGIEYVRTAVAAGIDAADFAPRLSFLFASRTAVLEELAKYRAARRIWARVMREEFGARDPRSLVLRFHARTPGTRADERQPQVDPVLVRPARTAVRTQQVLAYGAGVPATVDMFAGSSAVERLTDDLEAASLDLMGEVERRGGAVSATARGFQKREIERNAHRTARMAEGGPYEAVRIDPAIEVRQAERLCKLRAIRDFPRVDDALVRLKKAAEGTDNVLYPMKEALAAYATVGEVCDALREVWGTHTPAT
ncbi:methylmalonyl-CoA mutase family protein [Streptomyces sp. NPDC054854]